jgi:hypothetical protein
MRATLPPAKAKNEWPGPNACYTGAVTDERVQEGGARLGEEVVYLTDERVQEGGARLGEEVV